MIVQTKKSRLPSAYQEVEYIESTGNQYILLGLPAARSDLVGTELEAKFSSQRTNRTTEIICAFSTEGSWFGLSSSGYYTNGATNFPVSMDMSEHTIVIYIESASRNVYILDGEYTTERFISSLARREEGWLFGGFYGDMKWYSYSRIFYAVHRDKEGNILAKFIPCYRKSDGEIGMYDLVSNTFFTNQGTGTFLKGADV